ncbi:hypothetical protein DPEC_G00360490 [Dallia pectoralis]|uniref:Uncharacterized protein n=1 Tax=Dallia pectoralis TaxID=75939 RepID=A0ACC2F192_DALPE|nr:hypothetical protein DPEC_G00360490 [Dallia pectoralis]
MQGGNQPPARRGSCQMLLSPLRAQETGTAAGDMCLQYSKDQPCHWRRVTFHPRKSSAVGLKNLSEPELRLPGSQRWAHISVCQDYLITALPLRNTGATQHIHVPTVGHTKILQKKTFSSHPRVNPSYGRGPGPTAKSNVASPLNQSHLQFRTGKGRKCAGA